MKEQKFEKYTQLPLEIQYVGKIVSKMNESRIDFKIHNNNYFKI